MKLQSIACVGILCFGLANACSDDSGESEEGDSAGTPNAWGGYQGTGELKLGGSTWRPTGGNGPDRAGNTGLAGRESSGGESEGGEQQAEGGEQQAGSGGESTSGAAGQTEQGGSAGADGGTTVDAGTAGVTDQGGQGTAGEGNQGGNAEAGQSGSPAQGGSSGEAGGGGLAQGGAAGESGGAAGLAQGGAAGESGGAAGLAQGGAAGESGGVAGLAQGGAAGESGGAAGLAQGGAAGQSGSSGAAGIAQAGAAGQQQSSVVINEFSSSNTNEYVELYNPTSTAADVSGWAVEDDDDNRYTIPDETSIDPLGFLLVDGFAATSLDRDDRIDLKDASDQLVDSQTGTGSVVSQRCPDGGTWVSLGSNASTTPGASNDCR